MKFNSPILECIPNFSEGRDKELISKIAESIKSVKEVRLLHVDMGFAANRTVITFAGAPAAVAEAAFHAIKTAGELIDMRLHKGVHPRIGATDVVPLVPVSGISMNETIKIARGLAKRVGLELSIPVYCYEDAAFDKKRKKLEDIRRGEYESLSARFKDPEWRPDFGPETFNEKSGSTIIGARDFLIAFNVNLDTDSIKIASQIAADIRESGRTHIDSKGKKIAIPGRLKAVKAIGWYIEEYKKAQVSMNLTNVSVTPLHQAFEAVKEGAVKYGVKVTGSELIGMVPLNVLKDAGIYYKEKLFPDTTMNERSSLDLAVEQLGLSELNHFAIKSRVIEYALAKE